MEKINLFDNFERNILVLLGKPHYELAFILLNKFGFIWSQLLIKYGVNPVTAMRLISKLKKLGVIEETSALNREKLKEFLATRVRAGRKSLVKFKPYSLTPKAKAFFQKHDFVEKKPIDETLRELFYKYEEWRKQERAKKGEVKKVIGKCAICGEPIFKVIYFNSDKISYFGAESITGSKLPINGLDKPWQWVCGRCIRKDPKLRELREYIISHKIKENPQQDVKETIDNYKMIQEAREELKSQDKDYIMDNDKIIVSEKFSSLEKSIENKEE